MRYTRLGQGDFTPGDRDEPERFLTQEQESDFEIDVLSHLANTNKTTKTDLLIADMASGVLPSIERLLEVRDELVHAKTLAYERLFNDHANTEVNTMSKETYTLSNDAVSLTLTVNLDLFTVEKQFVINDFFPNPDFRISEENGDLLIAVLKLLFRQFVSHSFNAIDDPINSFVLIPSGQGIVLNDFGIELLSFNYLEIDAIDINVELHDGFNC